jgi:hypothetical protein
LQQEHKDPFDRFLIAIAKQESLTIITTDVKFKLYLPLIQIIGSITLCMGKQFIPIAIGNP